MAESAALDDRRTEEILRAHLKMSTKQWNNFDHCDLSFTAAEGVKLGIAQEIAEFSPPSGTKVFNIA